MLTTNYLTRNYAGNRLTGNTVFLAQAHETNAVGSFIPDLLLQVLRQSYPLVSLWMLISFAVSGIIFSFSYTPQVVGPVVSLVFVDVINDKSRIVNGFESGQIYNALPIGVNPLTKADIQHVLQVSG